MNRINANELLDAFSLALDVAENQPFGHAQRTAYIALQVARELKITEDNIGDIFAATLLHDIGLTTSKADPHSDVLLIVSHCQIGAKMVSSLPFSPKVPEYIRWHHANWDGSGPFERVGHDIPLGAQIIYLADKLDVKLRELESIYTDRTEIGNFIQKGSGAQFSPMVVEAFLAVQSKEIFWLNYSSSYLPDILKATQPKIELEILPDTLELIAQTFATIIDNKSGFTYEHSKGVTKLALQLGQYFGFDDSALQTLKISALLHDLGKLTIPNSILDKPGKLTPVEYQIIKSHAYYTKLILSKIKGMETIAAWAGNHHETLDGGGYPEGLPKNDLSLPERIISVSDVYQALTENRPYRNPLPQSQALQIIGEMVQNNKLCPEVFNGLKAIIV